MQALDASNMVLQWQL